MYFNCTRWTQARKLHMSESLRWTVICPLTKLVQLLFRSISVLFNEDKLLRRMFKTSELKN